MLVLGRMGISGQHYRRSQPYFLAVSKPVHESRLKGPYNLSRRRRVQGSPLPSFRTISLALLLLRGNVHLCSRFTVPPANLPRPSRRSGISLQLSRPSARHRNSQAPTRFCPFHSKFEAKRGASVSPDASNESERKQGAGSLKRQNSGHARSQPASRPHQKGRGKAF
jgi:hypothetical protein